MSMPESLQIPLFMDCDTGIDDALALAYLLAESTVRLVGIGTVSGNVDSSAAAANTLALLNLAGRSDVPVAVGENDPLVGKFGGGTPHVHGHNGIGDVELEPASGSVVAETAPAMLARLAREAGGALRILAVGPLTNLARFLEDNPECVSLIAEVIVMGGAFEHPGNVTPFAEANIHNDPEAAARVFEAAWPVTLLPLDITVTHALTEHQAVHLGEIPGALPPKVAAILDTYFAAYEGFYGARQCALHDPLAAILAADCATVLAEDRPAAIQVVTSGDERGRTVAIPGSGEGRPVSRRIVKEIDGDAADVLLRTIAGHTWPLSLPQEGR